MQAGTVAGNHRHGEAAAEEADTLAQAVEAMLDADETLGMMAGRHAD